MVLADSLFRDLRHGLRSLLLRPGFTLTVVATLALGLGVNAATPSARAISAAVTSGSSMTASR